MTEQEFERRADDELQTLEAALTGADLDLETDLSMGILTITFGDGTEYVINSHRAAKQIWMAAERNAWHFDPGATGAWIAHKSGDELWSTVSGVVGRKTGAQVALGRPVS